METKLRILILEDSDEDLYLVERELQRGGLPYTSTVVKKKEEYMRALKEFRPDVILSDHSLPQFNSIEAMKIWKEHQRSNNLTIPFILITGSVSEEFAVQSIKAGADDYILKDRLKRLPSSIQSALNKARLEHEKMRFLEEILTQSTLMKEAEHLANFGSWEVDLTTGKHHWSDEAFRIFGFKPGEVNPDYERFFMQLHPDDREMFKNIIHQAINGRPFQECEYRIINDNQRVKFLHSRILAKRDKQVGTERLIGFTLDITNLKLQTQALEMQNERLKEIAWVQSHEVRAPLARIMGLTLLLKDYSNENMDIQKTLGHLIDSANELDEIIRSIVRKTEGIV